MIPFAIPAALAAAGALAGGLSSATKKKARVLRSPTMTDRQIADSDWYSQQGRQIMQDPYKGFDPIRQQALNTYNQQLVPSLAERFTSMGAGNALSSPAFASQLGQMSQGLSENLAAMMARYGQQNQEFGSHLMGMGMQPQFENTYIPESQGFLSGMLGGLGGGLSSMAGAGMGQFLQEGGKGGMWGHGGFATRPTRPYADRHPESNISEEKIDTLIRLLGGGY